MPEAADSLISIHAPARGATALVFGGIQKQENFNPRSREGSDAYPTRANFRSIPFQSTLPRGERHRPVSQQVHDFDDFNPRSREGSDCHLAVQRCEDR